MNDSSNSNKPVQVASKLEYACVCFSSHVCPPKPKRKEKKKYDNCQSDMKGFFAGHCPESLLASVPIQQNQHTEKYSVIGLTFSCTLQL